MTSTYSAFSLSGSAGRGFGLLGVVTSEELELADCIGADIIHNQLHTLY